MEYTGSGSSMAAVWEQSLESGGVFTQSKARLFSAILTVFNIAAVWEEYGKSKVLVAFA